MAWSQQGAVLKTRLFADAAVALQNLHLMTRLCEPVSGGDADDPAAHHDYLHVHPADRSANAAVRQWHLAGAADKPPTFVAPGFCPR